MEFSLFTVLLALLSSADGVRLGEVWGHIRICNL